MEIELDPFEFMQLDKELQFQILLPVVYPDLIRFCISSKAAGEICRDNYFWEAKTIRDFGNRYDLSEEPSLDLRVVKAAKDLLKEFGYDIPEDPTSWTWLDSYKKFLRRAGYDLIEASQVGKVTDVKQLLNLGLNPDFIDVFGNTALMYASENGHAAIVRILLKEGADPNFKGVYLLRNDGSIRAFTKNYTPLMCASDGGHIEVVRDLLDVKAEIDVQEEKGRTALILAAWSGHEEVVDALVKAEANLDLLTTFEGDTALGGAIFNGEIDTALSLLDAGADPNIQAEGGFTALMTASEMGETELVKALLDKGADPKLETDEGATALTMAEEEGNTEIVELLKRYS